MKLSSLKDLKAIKKDLAPEPEKTSVNQPRPKTVVHPSKEEIKASQEGLTKGMKVRMMDSNETGIIVGFGKDFYEVELNGFIVPLRREEFYPVNADEDRRLRNAIPSRRAQAEEDEPTLQQIDPNADLTVDLHMERIPGNEGIPEWAALEFQMNYFRQVLRQNLKHRGRRIIFVHGVGDGTLASAIRKELDEVFALSCSYTVGTFGVTNVTIR